MNKLLKALFISITVCCSTNGQSLDCNILNEDFFFIKFDIRSNSNYPIIMCGITKNVKINNLKTENIDIFINDFYKNIYYVPEIGLSGYNSIISECMGKEKASIYIKQNPLIGSIMTEKLSFKCIKQKIKLKSGETVYFEITKIKGTFFVMNKKNKAIGSTSMELNIKEIDNIEECFIPFKIIKYSKPKKVEIFK